MFRILDDMLLKYQAFNRDSPMPVRPMHSSDLFELQALACQLWPDDPPPHFTKEQVFVWQRESGGLGGFVWFSVRPWVEGCDSQPCPHIEGWFVEADLRRRGIGRALIAAVENWCRDKGFREFTSDAESTNTTSLMAHDAIGFRRTTRIQYFKKEILS